MFWKRKNCKWPENPKMQTIEISGTEVLPSQEPMAGKEFLNWYDEDVTPEWSWQEEMPNILKEMKKLYLV